MKHINLSVPGGQGLDGTGLVEMKRAELKEVEGGIGFFGVAIIFLMGAIVGAFVVDRAYSRAGC